MGTKQDEKLQNTMSYSQYIMIELKDFQFRLVCARHQSRKHVSYYRIDVFRMQENGY